MAINFTRLFTSEGLLCGAVNETNTYRSTTLNTRKTDLITQFGTSSVYGDFVTGLYTTIESAKDSLDSYMGELGALASQFLINEAVADRPLANASFSNALAETVRQMKVAAESLNECPGTVVVADVGSPTGDHKFVFGVKEAITGRTTDFLVPDVYLIELSADRSNGGTAFAETFAINGKPADSLPTDATYPSGTGLSTSVAAINPASDGGLLTDPNFPNWEGAGNNTPSIPWAVFGTTVAGTHVLRASDYPRSAGGTYSLNFVGDGVVVPKVRQAVTLTANTEYSVCFRVKKVTDPGTDWAVSAILTDAAGTAVTGVAAYSNVVSSAAASSVTADWLNVVTGVFCTPAVLPTTQTYLELRFHQSGAVTTAPANTASAYVNFVSVQATEPLYSGGPTLTVFSGTAEGVVGDTRTATVSLSSGVPADYLIRGIDRLLSGGLASAAVRIPTSNAATQSDALVT